jgi:hypothetical protein
MHMLNMKTKKPTKPMLEIPEITDDAGLNSPDHSASTPTSRASHPIHRGSAGGKDGHRVQRNDHAEAEEVAGSVGREGVGGGHQRGLSPGSAARYAGTSSHPLG